MNYCLRYESQHRNEYDQPYITELVVSPKVEFEEALEILHNFKDKKIIFETFFDSSLEPIFEKIHLLKVFKEQILFRAPKRALETADLSNFSFNYMCDEVCTSIEELKQQYELGASEVTIDGGLFFSMDALKLYDIKIRKEPGRTLYGKGPTGAWLRPEDTHYYEGYINTLDFSQEPFERRLRLVSIYAEDKKWSGDINMILPAAGDYPLSNGRIPNDFCEHRLNCHHKCLMGSSCHLCDRLFATIKTLEENNRRGN